MFVGREREVEGSGRGQARASVCVCASVNVGEGRKGSRRQMVAHRATQLREDDDRIGLNFDPSPLNPGLYFPDEWAPSGGVARGARLCGGVYDDGTPSLAPRAAP